MPAEGVMKKATPPLFWKSSDGSALQEVFQERNEWVSEETVESSHMAGFTVEHSYSVSRPTQPN